MDSQCGGKEVCFSCEMNQLPTSCCNCIYQTNTDSWVLKSKHVKTSKIIDVTVWFPSWEENWRHPVARYHRAGYGPYASRWGQWIECHILEKRTMLCLHEKELDLLKMNSVKEIIWDLWIEFFQNLEEHFITWKKGACVLPQFWHHCLIGLIKIPFCSFFDIFPIFFSPIFQYNSKDSDKSISMTCWDVVCIHH